MHLLLIHVVHRLARNGELPWRVEVGRVCTALKYAGHSVSFLESDGADHEAIRKAIATKRPQHVLVYLPATAMTAGRRLVAHMSQTHFLPVIGFGPAATCSPEEVLSFPGMTGVALVECAEALVEYVARIEAGGDVEAPQQIPGMWFNSEGGTLRNEIPAPVEDLDAIDPPDRSYLPYQKHVDATGVAEFHATRGCPQQCTYCINDWIADAYVDKGTFCRRRGVEQLLIEIREVLGTYSGVKMLQFNDCMFAADEAWLAEFTERYVQQVGEPFACHVRANGCKDVTVEHLAAAGCAEVHVDVICGSSFVRNEVFEMDTSESQLVRVFDMLADAGIRSAAYCLVGSPYETEITIDQTAALVERLNPTALAVVPFYPMPATRARELCQDNGWLSGRGERAFHEGHSVLDMPALPPANIGQFVERFASRLRPGPGGKRRFGRGRTKMAARHPFQYPECDLFAETRLLS